MMNSQRLCHRWRGEDQPDEDRAAPVLVKPSDARGSVEPERIHIARAFGSAPETELACLEVALVLGGLTQVRENQGHPASALH